MSNVSISEWVLLLFALRVEQDLRNTNFIRFLAKYYN